MHGTYLYVPYAEFQAQNELSSPPVYAVLTALSLILIFRFGWTALGDVHLRVHRSVELLFSLLWLSLSVPDLWLYAKIFPIHLQEFLLVLYLSWGLLWPMCGVLAALVHAELHDHSHFSDHSLVLFRSRCSLSLPISNENLHQYPADWHYHVQVSVLCLGMSSSVRVRSRTDMYLHTFWSTMWPWNSIHVDDLSAMPLPSLDLHWRDRRPQVIIIRM